MPEDLAADPRVKKLTDKIEDAQKSYDKPKGDGNAPKTLVELGGRAVNASRQGRRNARGVLGGSSGDQTLPAGEPLTLEEQNAAVAAQLAPPNPNLEASHPNRMQRAYSLHDVVVPALQRRVRRRGADPLAPCRGRPPALRGSFCPSCRRNDHGRASPAMTTSV